MVTSLSFHVFQPVFPLNFFEPSFCPVYLVYLGLPYFLNLLPLPLIVPALIKTTRLNKERKEPCIKYRALQSARVKLLLNLLAHNAEHSSRTNRASTLSCLSAVLHFHLFGVLHFSLFLTLYAICFHLTFTTFRCI